jgi:hypothetical protein
MVLEKIQNLYTSYSYFNFKNPNNRFKPLNMIFILKIALEIKLYIYIYFKIYAIFRWMKNN